MKVDISMVLSVLAAGLVLVADCEGQQPRRKPSPDGGVRVSLPTGWGKLGLTSEQKIQILRARMPFQLKRNELMEQLDNLREAELAELSKFLTPVQKLAAKAAANKPVTPPALPPSSEVKEVPNPK